MSFDVACWVVAGAWVLTAVALSSGRATRSRAPAPALVGVVSAAAVAAQAAGVHTLARVGAALLPVAGTTFVLALPDGEFSGWSRRVTGAVLGGCAVPVVLGARGASWYGLSLGLVATLTAAVVIPLAHARYRRSTGGVRQRLLCVGLGMASVSEAAVVAVGLRLLVLWPGNPIPIMVVATAIIPMVFFASTQPALLVRVDRVLAVTVSAVALTASVGGFFLLAILGLGGLPSDAGRAVIGWSLGAAAAAALAFGSIRQRLAEVGNRIVYGEVVAPDAALRTFGSRLTRSVPMDELLLQLAESLRRTIGGRRAEIWTGTGGLYELAASAPRRIASPLRLGADELNVAARAGVRGGRWVTVWLGELAAGHDPACLRVAPLTHRGDVLGLILVERPEDSSLFTEADDQVLGELARQVSVALHNVQLDSALQQSFEEVQRKNVELQDSRARIVAAGDAERRKLERNLHDGAQQHLVAMSIKIGLARDALESDPADARGLIGELSFDIQEALLQLRSLAHGIYPPLLMAGGLPDALPVAARRASLPTTIERCVASRYSLDLEACVYFCCLEALQNAGKHAGPTAVATVRVWQDEDLLCFEVADTGTGFDRSGCVGPGHGFINMADRLGAMNGGLQVESAPGVGTRVCGQLPIATPADHGQAND